MTRWVSLSLGVLLAASCSRPLQPLEVGHKEYASDIVFGSPRTQTAPPVLVPPDALVTPPTVSALPVPLSPAPTPPNGQGGPPTPTAPAAPCAVADPRLPPQSEATNVVTSPPVAATYAYRNVGRVERSGANADKQDFAVESTRTVQAVRTTGGITDYEVASRFGAVVTTTGYRIVPVAAATPAEAAGLYITFTRSKDGDNAESGFDPEPNLLLLQLPAEVGRTWQSAGVDRSTGVAQRLSGTIRPKSRVDACGTPLDAWVVDVDGSVRSCGPPAPNGVPLDPVCGDVPAPSDKLGDPGAPRQAFKGTFFIGTQFGGLSLRDEIEIDSTEVGGGVFRSNVATINRAPAVS